MAKQLHNVGGKSGFRDNNIHYLSGTGLPGGDAGFQDAAPIGTVYNRVNGETYKKISLLNNTVADWEIEPTNAAVLNAQTTANNALTAANSATTAANTANTNTNTHIADLANPHGVTAVQTGAVPTTDVGIAGGVASLDGTGKVPTSQIPAVAITTVTPVADLATMLALVAQSGDVAVRADLTAAAGNTFMHNGGVTGTISDWTKVDNGYAVSTVNGQSGTVVLVAADIGADVAGAAAAVQANLNTTDTNVTNNTNAIATINANGAQNHSTLLAHSAGIVDSVPLADANGFKWEISAKSVATPTDLEMVSISAIHDGINVDYEEDSLLQLGASLGSSVSFAINAGNLEISSSYNTAVDLGITRVRI